MVGAVGGGVGRPSEASGLTGLVHDWAESGGVEGGVSRPLLVSNETVAPETAVARPGLLAGSRGVLRMLLGRGNSCSEPLVPSLGKSTLVS